MTGLPAIWSSPLALASLAIAAGAIAFAGASIVRARLGREPVRLRERLAVVASVLALCALAVAAVVRGLAR